MVKIADFGLAKAVSPFKSYATSKGKGTDAYSSPEVILGGSHKISTDVWSLGVILYELCTF